MAINYSSIKEFARNYGNVTLWTANKDSVIIGRDEVDVLRIAETAPTISFQGKDYTRVEFEKLMLEYQEKEKSK